MVGKRVKLIQRVTKTSVAQRGDIGTIEDFSAGGEVFIRWDARPHRLDALRSGVDLWEAIDEG